MSDLRHEIAGLEAERYGAMLSADAATLERLFAPDLHYMHSNADADDKAGYIGKIASGLIRYLRIDPHGAEIRLRGDHALVLGRMRADVVIAGEARTLDSKFMGVWRREDGGWLFEAFASTPVP